MKLKILIVLLQVALSESSGEVFGYLGDNITLPSGADPSLTLTKIEWSILSNNTFIATYRDKEKSIQRFHQYIGRLDLNVSTGDLMISNLTTKDDMNYTVVFTNDKNKTKNKIKLTVRQRLQKPNIRTQTFHPSGRVKTGCWIEALCSSSDEGVEFSWKVTPSNVTTLSTSLHGDRASVLLAFINSTQAPATFNCTISKSMVETWSTAAPVCEDEQTHPSIQPPPPARQRYCTLIAIAAFTGCLLTIVLFFFCGEKKETASAQSVCVPVAAVGTSTPDLSS